MYLSKLFIRNMCVDLGRSNIFMPEKLLNWS